MIALAKLIDPGLVAHPFWIFDWDLLMHAEVPLCSSMLFLSAVLCSAAGIGGGGIYVALLMVLGGVSTRNAVPLSKAVVFFGAVASTVLNLRRQLFESSKSSGDKRCINFEICWLVAPMALSGTFLGVLLNFHMPAKVIVVVLTLMLCFMLVMVVRTAWSQHCEEEDALLASPEEARTLVQNAHAAQYGAGSAAASWEAGPPGQAHLAGALNPAEFAKRRSRDELSPTDIFAAIVLVILVVLGGVLRFHLRACKAEKEGLGVRGSCRHPVVNAFFAGHFDGWMNSNAFFAVLQCIVITCPLWACVMLSLFYGGRAVSTGWKPKTVVAYQATALATGLLAGLVGIGGGLIFSPFFLLMGLEPHVAVATSSTCVLFTSSSTTIQYLFTDRIMMSLAVFYGAVTLLGSYFGTTLVHFLQDHFQAKRSYISWVVAAGVALSALLSMAKFARLMTVGESMSFF